MRYQILSFLLITAAISAYSKSHDGIHLPIYRRGGRFTRHEPFNHTTIVRALAGTEARYLRTVTEADGNRVVRRWAKFADNADNLFNNAGSEGSWYTILPIGEPPQDMEVDIDMLSPDFYTVMTTSGRGSQYNIFGSTEHQSSPNHPHPLCSLSTDQFQFSSLETPLRLTLPLCQAPKYSLHTLQTSGSILGLAPVPYSTSLDTSSNPLSRFSLHSSNVAELLSDLFSQDALSASSPIWSLTLLDSSSGVLSIGTTLAAEIEGIKIRTKKELLYLPKIESAHVSGSYDLVEDLKIQMEADITGALAFSIPDGSTYLDHFKFSDSGAQGIKGWWTTLIQGIWINGVKVLKNQVAVLDVNSPVVLGPRDAVGTFWDAVAGARPLWQVQDNCNDHEACILPSAGDNGVAEKGSGEDDENKQQYTFHAFPCLNEINIEFEIAGWRFPYGKGELREDAVHGPMGGLLSLGQPEVNGDNASSRSGTGYCVGNIVGTNLGLRKEGIESGMQDMWVLGEPFFRATGIVFDPGHEKTLKERVGFRIF